MPGKSESDILRCYRDAKVEGRAILLRNYVPFQESYIAMLKSSLQREGLLEWDDERGGLVISEKGLQYINRSAPYKPPVDSRSPHRQRRADDRRRRPARAQTSPAHSSPRSKRSSTRVLPN